MKKLYVIIGCDSDADRPGFVPGVIDEGTSWRGLLEGPELLRKALSGCRDSVVKNPKVTWVIRVDAQVEKIYGDCGWVLEKYKDNLLNLEAGGDELGWHPHFYKYDDGQKRWYQEVGDTDWQLQMLEKGFAAYQRVFPGRARSVRMGWIYHNNLTMQKLSQLGVRVEFSALPGLRTYVKSGKRPYNIFDWYVTPGEAYFPSTVDFRRPAKGEERALPILEIPNFVSNSRLWGMITGLQFTRKMKKINYISDAFSRPTYWINITGAANLFAPVAKSLENFVKKADSSVIFATYFHADELLNNGKTLYSLPAMQRNIELILSNCERDHIPVEFITATEALKIIQPQ